MAWLRYATAGDTVAACTSAINAFSGGILAGGNYLKWGVLARYELAAPGYQRAIAALNRIDVGRTPKHFTVTKDVLALAYKESPTFRELQPFMDGWPDKCGFLFRAGKRHAWRDR